MQFERAIVAMAAAVALVSVVRAGALGGGGPSWEASVEVQAAREAARVKAGEQLTLPQMVAVLRVSGWPEKEIPEALDVAACESDWRPDAVGTYAERGLFQIHPMHNYRFQQEGEGLDAFNPLHNAAVALAIWELYGWEPWTCQPG
jgi:hypothetical protein